MCSLYRYRKAKITAKNVASDISNREKSVFLYFVSYVVQAVLVE